MSRPINAFISGMAAGIAFGILFAPMEGRKLRRLLFKNRNDSDILEEGETYSINELISKDSTSFDELKEKINNGH